ncbi:MAG: hypothetical protein RQ824_04290 [bacterium]|nr:hypothetical protein [bacterium]
MSNNPLLPDKEDLRKAVKWISRQGEFSLKIVDEASIRFDLSPADEDFLINHFTGKKDNSFKQED